MITGWESGAIISVEEFEAFGLLDIGDNSRNAASIFVREICYRAMIMVVAGVDGENDFLSDTKGVQEVLGKSRREFDAVAAYLDELIMVMPWESVLD